MNSLRIVWVGGGSLGLLFAARHALSDSGRHTLLVRNGRQLHKINKLGLELIAQDGRFTAFLPCADHMPDEPADWIMLMVKQTHLSDPHMAEQLAQWSERNPDANWLCFQNGIGHVEHLRRWIPAERLHVAVTTEAANRLDWRTVHHTGHGTTRIGCVASFAARHEQKNLIETFRGAGFDACLSNNIMETVWEKLLINAVINPLTAILGVRNGELLASPERVAWMRRLFLEGVEAARADGVSVPDSLWDRLLAVCRSTAANRSSMLQDVMNGRRTETPWINGSLVRIAARHGVPMPAHAEIVRRMNELEARMPNP